MVQEPDASIVTFEPDTDHNVGVRLSNTGESPDDVDAEMGNGVDE